MTDPDNQLDLALFCPTCGKPTKTEKTRRRKTASKARTERLKIINVLAKLTDDETTSQGFIVQKTKLSPKTVYNQLQMLIRWSIVVKLSTEKHLRYRLNV